ncbi:glutathione S-transferase family protein [Yunchengibacter salinarum]|uniref:glutathione S-transferase family protein n=1 Tax=Yunchengibacter salinarum TaxID=3133399 RepID=UPI0035B67035
MSKLTLVIGNRTYSSWSLRGWLAVRQTGFRFEEVILPLETDQFYDEVESWSPSRTVPALNHRGARIWDSLAIVDYCARLNRDAFFWPSEFDAFGYAKSIAAEMHSSFSALRRAAPMNLRKRYTGLTMDADVARDLERIDTLWCECLDHFGGDGGYLFGDFSAADMMFAPVATRVVTYDLPMSTEARRYVTTIMEHPFMLDWCAAAEQETAILKSEELAEGQTHLSAG